MNEFEKKILKFGIVLLGVFLLNTFALFMLPDIVRIFQLSNDSITIMKYLPRIMLNLLFGIILFIDSRDELPNSLLISILGLLIPIVGLMFYFIEKFLLSKIQDYAK